jgi:hypothetical protein
MGMRNAKLYSWIVVGTTASFLFVCATTNAAKTADKDDDRLIGPVQQVIEESNDTQTDPWHVVQTTTYDRVGNLMQVETSMGRTSVLGHEKTIYERNSDGHTTSAKTLGDNGSMRVEHLYVNDAKGNEIEDHYFDTKGKLLLIHANAYDAEGKKIETKTYFNKRSLKSKMLYTYSPEGKITTTASFYCTSSQDCKLESRAENKYDVKGNRVDRAIYEADGTVVKRYMYGYNPEGRLEQEIVYYCESDSFTETAYEHDSAGNWIRKTATHTYHTPIFKGLLRPSGRGNLIDDPPQVTKRTIIYYK